MNNYFYDTLSNSKSITINGIIKANSHILEDFEYFDKFIRDEDNITINVDNEVIQHILYIMYQVYQFNYIRQFTYFDNEEIYNILRKNANEYDDNLLKEVIKEGHIMVDIPVHPYIEYFVQKAKKLSDIKDLLIYIESDYKNNRIIDNIKYLEYDIDIPKYFQKWIVTYYPDIYLKYKNKFNIEE